MKKQNLLLKMLLLCLCVVGSTNVWADEVTISMDSSKDWTYSSAGSGISVTSPSKSSGTTYHQISSGAITIVAESSKTITGISLTFNRNNTVTIKADEDVAVTYSESWTGSAQTIIIADGASSSQARISSIIVTYTSGGGGGGSTTYSVTYNGNSNTSGTVPEDDNAYESGDEVTVKGNSGSLTKTNYDALAYWNTENDGSGTNYEISTGTFDITEDTELFAKWTQSGTINANGGSSNTTYTATLNAGTITVTTAPTRDGYSLKGYYTAASGGTRIVKTNRDLVTGGTDYTNSDGKWTNTAAAPTLYAQWEENSTPTWDFTASSSAINDEFTAMAEDETNWSVSGTTATYKTLNYQTPKISDNVFSVTKGLKLCSNSAGRFKIVKGTKLTIIDDGFISIPNLKAGWTVECYYEVTNAADNIIVPSNLNITEGFVKGGTGNEIATGTKVTGKGTVKYDGCVTLSPGISGKTATIYSITVKDDKGVVKTSDQLYTIATTPVSSAAKIYSYNTTATSSDATNLDADVSATKFWSKDGSTYKNLAIISVKTQPFLIEADSKALDCMPGFHFLRIGNANIGAAAISYTPSENFTIIPKYSVIIPNIHIGDIVEISARAGSSGTATFNVTGAATFSEGVTNSGGIIKKQATENGELYINIPNGSKNAVISYIKIIPAYGKVTEYGWSTYIANYDVAFADGIAYKVTGVNSSTGAVTVENVTSIPAGTPVLLKGEGVKAATLLTESPSAIIGNKLEVYDGSDKGSKVPYVLAKNGESAGFKKWTGALTKIENRVVLWLDSEITAREFFFFDESETTEIADVRSKMSDVRGDFFDLSGRKVAQPTQGLYIVNGKKVIVK